MKVQDLFEYYHKPKVVDVSSKKTADGGKIGKMHGPVPDWLKAMNDHMTDPITPEKVAEARPKIKASAEYKRLIDAGWKDESSSSAEKKGTFVMVRPDGQRFHILVTGKINDRTTDGGGIRKSPVPRIVPNDAVATVVKTMAQTMKYLAGMKAVKEGFLEEENNTLYGAAKKLKMRWLTKMLDAAGSKALKDGSMWDAEEGGDGVPIPIDHAKEIIKNLKSSGYKFTEQKYRGKTISIMFFADDSGSTGISVGVEDADDEMVYSFQIFDEE